MNGSARRVGAISLKVLRTLKHDRRSLALILVAPVLAMAVFGFAFGSEVKNVPVVVANDDTGDLAADVIANLPRENVSVRVLATRAEAEAAVRAGEARAMYYFPASFTEDASPRVPEGGQTTGLVPPVGGQGAPPQRPTPPRGTNVTVVLDGSASQMAAVALRSLGEGIQKAMETRGGKSPIGVETEYAYAEGATQMDFFVPGIMAFAALMFTTLLTLLAFVGERTSGTLSRLLMTPVAAWEIVAGYAAAFGIVAAAQGTILLTVAILVFDALLAGSLVLAFAAIILMALNAMSLGILFSALAQKEAQAVQFLPLVIFPAFLLSGIFVPTETLPAWLRPFAYAIPPTYAVDALRAVMLRGWGLAEVWQELAILVAFAAGFLSLAVVGLRRQRA